MMNRNEEAHAACLNILSDNKDSAPRIAELCTLSRLLGSEVDAITAERDEWKRQCEQADLMMLHYFEAEHRYRMQKRGLQKHWSQTLAENLIAEGRDND